MSKSTSDIIADRIADGIFDALGGNKWVGRYGEKLAARELYWLKLIGKNGLTLKNIYIPKDDGGTSEIDLVYITVKGIFVIESKNYSGWIFGDENSFQWTSSLPNGEKNKFYNPILQNKNHIKWLKNYLGEDIPMYSLIVFSNRCKLKKVPEGTTTTRVIYRDRIPGNIRYMWNKSDEDISKEEVHWIYDMLKPLTDVTEAEKQAHIENINNRQKPISNFNIVQSFQNITVSVDDKICPRCGSKLVIRTAKRGPNVGNRFYGCSSYPKCRYTEEIPKEDNYEK